MSIKVEENDEESEFTEAIRDIPCGEQVFSCRAVRENVA
jgi:hypothetical protein